MNRREFIKSVLGIGAATAVAPFLRFGPMVQRAIRRFPVRTRRPEILPWWPKGTKVADTMFVPSEKNGMIIGTKPGSTVHPSLSRLGKPMKNFNIDDISGVR